MRIDTHYHQGHCFPSNSLGTPHLGNFWKLKLLTEIKHTNMQKIPYDITVTQRKIVTWDLSNCFTEVVNEHFKWRISICVQNCRDEWIIFCNFCYFAPLNFINLEFLFELSWWNHTFNLYIDLIFDKIKI